MDKINEWVEAARKNGQTEEQIVHSLINMKFTATEADSIVKYGKLPAGTTARPTTVVAPTPAHKGPSGVLIAIISFIFVALIGSAAVTLWFVMKNQSPRKIPNSENQPKNSTSSAIPLNSLPSVSGKALVAYVQDASPSGTVASESAMVVSFDLNTKKRLSPNISVTSNSIITGAILGSWSPSGQYLPILVMQENQVNPLFLYNSSSEQTKQIVSNVNTRPLLKNNGSSFLFQSFWKDTQTFVYGPEYIDSNPPTSLVTLDLNGKEGTLSAQLHSFTLRNLRLVVTYSFSFTNSGRIDKIEKITLDGKTLDFAPAGVPIGTIGNTLVTATIPTAKTAADLSADKTFQTQLAKVKDEKTAHDLMEQYLAPKGDTVIHIYDLSGKETKSFTLPATGWTIVSIQVRNPKNTLIVHETDTYLSPKNSRFVEIIPNSPDQQRIITQVNSENGEESKSTGYGSFNITEDGNWLVFYEPSTLKSHTTNYSIAGINLDTRERQMICLDLCSNLRVFNPSALTYR